MISSVGGVAWSGITRSISLSNEALNNIKENIGGGSTKLEIRGKIYDATSDRGVYLLKRDWSGEHLLKQIFVKPFSGGLSSELTNHLNNSVRMELPATGGIVRVTHAELKAVDSWTNNPSINHKLRADKPLNSQESTNYDGLLSLLHKLPGSDQSTLWRGVFNTEIPKKGMIFSDKGFMSASTDRVTAEVYAGIGQEDGIPYNPIIYKIESSASGKDISELSHHKYNNLKEILFEPGVFFKVKDVRPSVDGTYTEVTVKEVPKPRA